MTTAQAHEVKGTTLDERHTAVGLATLPLAEIPAWLATTYHAVADLLSRCGTWPAGPPFARYHFLENGHVEVEAGFPVPAPIEAEGTVRPSTLPGGPVAVTLHVGSYDELEPAYDAVAAWIDAAGGEPVGDAWEVYYTDPRAQPDPATWRTEVVQAYRPR